MSPLCRHSKRAPRQPSVGQSHLNRAFTLVELLAVMSIVIVLTSLLAPAFRGIMGGRSVDSSVNTTWSAVSAARQQAITRRAPVALVFTLNRQRGDANKSDAFLLLGAQPPDAAKGESAWKWTTLSTWLKLPHGVSVTAGEPPATPTSAPSATNGFYLPSSPAPLPICSAITQAMPKLEGDTISTSDYVFAIFRPDGSVMSLTANPYFVFTKLQAKDAVKEAAIVLSPDSGRVRLVRY